MNAESELHSLKMMNEYAYYARLFWLEHVEQEFATSFDSVDGDRVHRRVDRPAAQLPDGSDLPSIDNLEQIVREQIAACTAGGLFAGPAKTVVPFPSE